MKKEINVVEKLIEVQEKERKRRDTAVKYLEELVEILEPVFLEIEGESLESDMIDAEMETDAIWIPIWDKEKGKYSAINSDLYFRYNNHYGTNDTENPGFYVSTNYLKVWGENLLDIKGDEFWIKLKRITDWMVNYLPDYLENKDKNRDERLKGFEKVMKEIEKLKN
mgnify:CR=1 FL=1